MSENFEVMVVRQHSIRARCGICGEYLQIKGKREDGSRAESVVVLSLLPCPGCAAREPDEEIEEWILDAIGKAFFPNGATASKMVKSRHLEELLRKVRERSRPKKETPCPE